MELKPALQLGTQQNILLRRGAALLLDVGFWLILTSIPGIGELLVYSRVNETGITTISYGGLVFLVYFTVSQGVFAQTIGKFLLGIGVADSEGNPCSFLQAGGRSLFLIVDIALLGIPALLSMYFSENRQRIGDRVAGTLVVRAER